MYYTTLLTNSSLERPNQSVYSKMVIDCTTVRDAFEGLVMSVDKWTPSITCCGLTVHGKQNPECEHNVK